MTSLCLSDCLQLSVIITKKYTNLKSYTQSILHIRPLSVLMAIFPGEPRLVGFTGAKDDGSGGDNWSYNMCKAAV